MARTSKKAKGKAPATAKAAADATAKATNRMKTRSQTKPTAIANLTFTKGNAVSKLLRYTGQATARKLSRHQFMGAEPLNPKLKELSKLKHYPHGDFEGKKYDWKRARDGEKELERERLQGREAPEQAVLTSQGEEALKSLNPPAAGGEILQGEDAVMFGAGEVLETAQEEASEYATAEESFNQDDSIHYDTAREDFFQDTVRKAIARKRATRKHTTHKTTARKDTTRKVVTSKATIRKAVSVQAAPRKPTTRNDTARKNTAQDNNAHKNIAQKNTARVNAPQENTAQKTTAHDANANVHEATARDAVHADIAYKTTAEKREKGTLHTVQTPRGPYTIFISQKHEGTRHLVFKDEKPTFGQAKLPPKLVTEDGLWADTAQEGEHGTYKVIPARDGPNTIFFKHKHRGWKHFVLEAKKREPGHASLPAAWITEGGFWLDPQYEQELLHLES